MVLFSLYLSDAMHIYEGVLEPESICFIIDRGGIFLMWRLSSG